MSPNMHSSLGESSKTGSDITTQVLLSKTNLEGYMLDSLFVNSAIIPYLVTETDAFTNTATDAFANTAIDSFADTAIAFYNAIDLFFNTTTGLFFKNTASCLFFDTTNVTVLNLG